MQCKEISIKIAYAGRLVKVIRKRLSSLTAADMKKTPPACGPGAPFSG